MCYCINIIFRQNIKSLWILNINRIVTHPSIPEEIIVTISVTNSYHFITLCIKVSCNICTEITRCPKYYDS